MRARLGAAFLAAFLGARLGAAFLTAFLATFLGAAFLGAFLRAAAFAKQWKNQVNYHEVEVKCLDLWLWVRAWVRLPVPGHQVSDQVWQTKIEVD